MDNDEIKENELLALKSIYDKDIYLSETKEEISNIFKLEDKHSGIIKINCLPTQIPYKIIIGKENLYVQHLPPIFLAFTLPNKYPESPPIFDLICFWLKDEDIFKISKRLLELWEEEQAEMLFTFIDFVQNSLFEYLNYYDFLYVDKVNTRHFNHKFINDSIPQGLFNFKTDELTSTKNVKSFLRDWDSFLVRKEFELTPHSCAICFEVKRGRNSISLKRCSHVYCKECLSGFFQMMIREGLVFSVLCPHDECRLARKGAKPNQEELRPDLNDILELVGKESFTRYEKLYNKQSYEMDPLITWCPIPRCNGPVKRMDENEKLCICPTCSFAFCHFCKRTWHGSQTFCEMPKNNKIGEQYYQARLNGDIQELGLLEVKYGKKNLIKLAGEYETQRQFDEWRSSNTQSCPKCFTAIEKSFGCNHMSCPVCDCHFCYICGNSINKYNPYSHFNDMGSTCHMRLFEGVQDDEEFVFDPFDMI